MNVGVGVRREIVPHNRYHVALGREDPITHLFSGAPLVPRAPSKQPEFGSTSKPFGSRTLWSSGRLERDEPPSSAGKSFLGNSLATGLSSIAQWPVPSTHFGEEDGFALTIWRPIAYSSELISFASLLLTRSADRPRSALFQARFSVSQRKIPALLCPDRSSVHSGFTCTISAESAAV